jgi:arylformamidase
LIEIDCLSIGDGDAQRGLLDAGVVAVEGLDLRRVEPRPYELFCLPLKVVGADSVRRVVAVRWARRSRPPRGAGHPELGSP